jgi:curved DNA-binding protein CbpA
MADPVSAERTAELLLWYLQEPARYRAEGRRRDAPLLDSEIVLKLALGRRVDLGATALRDAQTVALLQDAAALYVRFLFFRPDATPYQTLGLAPGASPATIKESFRLLMQLVHPDRQDARAVWPDSFAALANRAYGVLRNQDARAKFDREAQTRAAMARAMHRAAAASAASRMPVVLQPRPRLGGSALLRRMWLPEWLTAGLGGYAREHPATIAFAVLVGVAALAVGTLAWEGKDGWLTREVGEDPASAAPRDLAAAPAPGGDSSRASGVPEPASIAEDGRQPAQAAAAETQSPFAGMDASEVSAPGSASESSVSPARAAPAEALAQAAPVA